MSYDPTAEAERIIAGRQSKTQQELGRDDEKLLLAATQAIADELTRTRCELTALRLLASALLERREGPPG